MLVRGVEHTADPVVLARSPDAARDVGRGRRRSSAAASSGSRLSSVTTPIAALSGRLLRSGAESSAMNSEASSGAVPLGAAVIADGRGRRGRPRAAHRGQPE